MQKVIVFLVVCAAVLFLSRKISFAFSGKNKEGCSSGCGCKTKAADE